MVLPQKMEDSKKTNKTQTMDLCLTETWASHIIQLKGSRDLCGHGSKQRVGEYSGWSICVFIPLQPSSRVRSMFFLPSSELHKEYATTRRVFLRKKTRERRHPRENVVSKHISDFCSCPISQI